MIKDILFYTFIGAIAVLVIMNPKGFASDVQSVGGVYTQETTILTGSGYK